MKKGDMTLQTIAAIVLILVVIFIVGWIYKDYIFKLASRIVKPGQDVPENPEDCDKEQYKGSLYCKTFFKKPETTEKT